VFCISFNRNNKLKLQAYPEQSDFASNRFVEEINTSPLLRNKLLYNDAHLLGVPLVTSLRPT